MPVPSTMIGLRLTIVLIPCGRVASAQADWAQVKEGLRVGRMNATLDKARVTNVRPVSKPTVEPTPIQMLGMPHRLAITGLGGVFGLAFSVGVYLFLVTLREAGFLPQRRRKGEPAEQKHLAGDDELWMVDDIVDKEHDEKHDDRNL